ncbi:MAG: MBL fold metallo-hydrolase [Spirochaetia bacterium]|jgi:L-ascorbate metabolism protein UlaG (beta-lactamase superfamily)
MATRITFYGLAAYGITTSEGKVILIDPCLEDNPASPLKVAALTRVDLLLLSHLAFDHLGDAVAIARKTRCLIVCGAEVKHVLVKKGVDAAQIRTLSWGVQLLVANVRVRSVMSRHSSMGTDPDGHFISGFPMGFIVYAEPGVRIYHSGDTALYSDLKLIGEMYRPTIGLISCCEVEKNYLTAHGILDHYASEMTGDEGALAALWLRVDFALCNHYLYPENHVDIDRFVSLLNARTSDESPQTKPVVMRAGDTFIYPPGELQRGSESVGKEFV